MKISGFFVIICAIVILACNKKNNDNQDNINNSILNSFLSLTAENDTLFIGGSTKIKALIDGSNVSFNWSATAGDILGSGNEVTYVAPTCTPGNNEVKCTASASNKSESKTIIITVF